MRRACVLLLTGLVLAVTPTASRCMHSAQGLRVPPDIASVSMTSVASSAAVCPVSRRAAPILSSVAAREALKANSGPRIRTTAEASRPVPAANSFGSHHELGTWVVRAWSRDKTTPRPIMATPRPKWSQLSAVLRGTKFAALVWSMTKP
jgi:hypothetical protein